MGKLEVLREEALKKGVPAPDVERWLSTARRRVTLLTTGDGPVVGQAGGHPILPVDAPDIQWPFVFSLDCAAIPRQATDIPLPPDGHLLFFTQSDDFGPDLNGEVMYVPAGIPVVERTSLPDDFPRSDLYLSIVPSMPDEGPDQPEHPYLNELKDVWTEKKDDIIRDGPIRIGGYPDEIQINPVEQAEEEDPGKEWILLAEWDTPVWSGALGIVHWVIPREDLAARRFDQVRISLDIV
ncbi:YwqG family protein [Actinoallomurus sp. NBC_01490]|uniref:DUF1963 domain-containing protein n=1 Tax=Actinoallomurus sp. NBC_01490 TaxID=2903557 RepID=UPI002E358E83|nr:DUF1963 domain-containing protein [Actinoallomurus sp. NBC_01490]